MCLFTVSLLARCEAVDKDVVRIDREKACNRVTAIKRICGGISFFSRKSPSLTRFGGQQLFVLLGLPSLSGLKKLPTAFLQRFVAFKKTSEPD